MFGNRIGSLFPSILRLSCLQATASFERADLAIARRNQGDEQGALALIDELKAYRETLSKYHQRRLFPTRTLHIIDMAIAAAEGRGDDALEAYALTTRFETQNHNAAAKRKFSTRPSRPTSGP
jgi:hypothetical protein